MITHLVSITTARASFGLVVRDGVVIDAAPIARRDCLGRNARAVVAAYLRRGARVAVMDDPKGGA